MSLLDVDGDVPRRVEAIAAGGLRALGEVRQRAEDIDKAVDAMFARQERVRQELDEQVRQAAAARVADAKKEQRPAPKRTLSLGGEEFRQARADRGEPGAKDVARSAEVAADQREERPVRRQRPPRPASDDDMSGRTWLR